MYLEILKKINAECDLLASDDQLEKLNHELLQADCNEPLSFANLVKNTDVPLDTMQTLVVRLSSHELLITHFIAKCTNPDNVHSFTFDNDEELIQFIRECGQRGLKNKSFFSCPSCNHILYPNEISVSFFVNNFTQRKNR